MDNVEEIEEEYKGIVYASRRCNLCGEIVTCYADNRKDERFVCNKCKADLRKPVGQRRFDSNEEGVSWETEEVAGARTKPMGVDTSAYVKDERCTASVMTEEERRRQEIRRLLDARNPSLVDRSMAGTNFLPVSNRVIMYSSKRELQKLVMSGKLSLARYRMEMGRREKMNYFADCIPSDMV